MSLFGKTLPTQAALQKALKGKVKDLGAISGTSAYEYAVAGGYDGTEEEFAKVMAKMSNVAEHTYLVIKTTKNEDGTYTADLEYYTDVAVAIYAGATVHLIIEDKVFSYAGTGDVFYFIWPEVTEDETKLWVATLDPFFDVKVSELGGGKDIDLSGYVKSVNGVSPDENGNVEITIPDSSQNANQGCADYSFLSGLKYYACGDSIVDMQGTLDAPETFGDTGYTSDLQSRNITDITVEGYVTAIERRYGLVATNFGKGGHTLVGDYADLAVKDYSNVALVTLAYGVNDARSGVPLGTVNSTDVTTFAGALNCLLRKIYTDNPECRVVVLTPIQRLYVSDFGIATPNTYGKYLVDYVDMCKKVAAKRSTKCIDMYRDCGINQTNLYYYTVEGVHPVNQGFARMKGAIIPVLDELFAMEFEPFGTMTNAGDTEPDEPETDTGTEEDTPVDDTEATIVDITGIFDRAGFYYDGSGSEQGQNGTDIVSNSVLLELIPGKTYTYTTYVVNRYQSTWAYMGVLAYSADFPETTGGVTLKTGAGDSVFSGVYDPTVEEINGAPHSKVVLTIIPDNTAKYLHIQSSAHIDDSMRSLTYI